MAAIESFDEEQHDSMSQMAFQDYMHRMRDPDPESDEPAGAVSSGQTLDQVEQVSRVSMRRTGDRIDSPVMNGTSL
jgi:hypothetical protein